MRTKKQRPWHYPFVECGLVLGEGIVYRKDGMKVETIDEAKIDRVQEIIERPETIGNKP